MDSAVVLFCGSLIIFGFVLTMGGYMLAAFIPILRPFYCKVFPWHSPSRDTTGFNGASVQAKCQWCGYEGMIDSQGNLF